GEGGVITIHMSRIILSRRDALVKTGALGLAFLSSDIARADVDNPKATTGSQLAQVEKAHPAGSEAADGASKLDPRALKLAQQLHFKTRHAFALAAANPTANFAAGSIHSVAKNMYGQLSSKRQARAKTKAT